MAEERIYTIPLRKEFLKVPKYKRTARAVKAVKKFLQKHMKSEEVKIGKYLNDELWKHGKKNPPCRIQVKVSKDDNIVKAELINAPVEKEEKKKTKEPTEKAEEIKDNKEAIKEKILEKGIENKERKVLMEAEGKPLDLIKHESLDTKQEQQKFRAQKIITKTQKPTHEKKVG